MEIVRGESEEYKYRRINFSIFEFEFKMRCLLAYTMEEKLWLPLEIPIPYIDFGACSMLVLCICMFLAGRVWLYWVWPVVTTAQTRARH